MAIAEGTGTVSHFIGGEDVGSASGRTFASIDPSTGLEIAQVAFGEAEDVDRAVARRPGGLRSRARGRRRRPATGPRCCADSATSSATTPIGSAAIESRDTGKPLGQATAEVALGADFFTYFAGHAELPNGRTHPADAGYFVYSIREPYGVVGAISPGTTRSCSRAGRPPPHWRSATRSCSRWPSRRRSRPPSSDGSTLEAGMPAGVFNIVHGDGPTTGAALVAHPNVPKLTFTGSTAVGQAILRSRRRSREERPPRARRQDAEHRLRRRRHATRRSPARCSPPSTTPARSARAARACSSSAAIRTRSSSRSWSAPARSRSATRPTAATQLGPLISQEQYDRVTGYIEEGQRGGARLALGGGRPQVPVAGGYFVEPTIFVDVTPDMRIAKEEIFGPVLSVLTFEDEDEAIRIANDVMYGLAATRLDDRPRARVPGRREDRRRDHLDELPALPAGQRAVRGPQDVGPRRGPRASRRSRRSPTSRPTA